MGFGAVCPNVSATLEPAYSTWTKKWQWDFPEGLRSLTYVSITLSPDYLYILYDDKSYNARLVTIGISDASEKFTSPAGENYLAKEPAIPYTMLLDYNTLVLPGVGGASFSIRGKYVVIGVPGLGNFLVFKDGVLTWVSPSADEAVEDASEYGALAIRHDGKYVIAVTDNEKLVCFEGS